MIHVTIEGFGSIWSKRTRPDPRNPEHKRTAYYNTTGITVCGKVRPRSRIFGQLRFNGTGGFIAAGIERNIGRIFQCFAELDGTVHKLIFHPQSSAASLMSVSFQSIIARNAFPHWGFVLPSAVDPFQPRGDIFSIFHPTAKFTASHRSYFQNAESFIWMRWSCAPDFLFHSS